MKRITVLFLGLISLLISNANSAEVSTSKTEFCSDRKQKGYIKDLLQTYEANMSFVNKGGLVGGGVCWWHSRFVRKAAYLTYYRPDLDYPTKEEVKKIVDEIRHGKKVVMIPGYNNFYEFSFSNKSIVQKELEDWQMTDGFINQQWIVGLWGSSKNSKKALKKKMDKLYKYVKKGNNIAYQKLQIKGITAHAWLVVDMTRTDDGYELKVIDSNYKEYPQTYTYSYGDESFSHPHYGNFVPYLGRKKEEKKLKNVVKKFCK